MTRSISSYIFAVELILLVSFSIFGASFARQDLISKRRETMKTVCALSRRTRFYATVSYRKPVSCSLSSCLERDPGKDCHNSNLNLTTYADHGRFAGNVHGATDPVVPLCDNESINSYHVIGIIRSSKSPANVPRHASLCISLASWSTLVLRLLLNSRLSRVCRRSANACHI